MVPIHYVPVKETTLRGALGDTEAGRVAPKYCFDGVTKQVPSSRMRTCCFMLS